MEVLNFTKHSAGDMTLTQASRNCEHNGTTAYLTQAMIKLMHIYWVAPRKVFAKVKHFFQGECFEMMNLFVLTISSMGFQSRDYQCCNRGIHSTEDNVCAASLPTRLKWKALPVWQLPFALIFHQVLATPLGQDGLIGPKYCRPTALQVSQ